MLLSLGMLMLSATQIYTIFTVHLFAFLNLLPVDADIAAYSSDNKTQTFDDLPARFGYRLPSEGLKGFLVVAVPENACETIDPPPLKDNSTGTFIVLIKRFDCNFDVKLISQLVPSKIRILLLAQLKVALRTPRQACASSVLHQSGHIVLLPDYSLPLEYYLIPFLIIVGICLILIVVFMITKFVQDRHRARRSRLRKDQLKKLPVHKYKKGDVYDVCAICLDEYEEGDKLRELPCSHAYHCKCVDPWLTKTKKTCPVCKQKVVPSQGDSDSDTNEAGSSHEENDDVSESTPLLRSLASTSAHSFGTTSESRSRQEVLESSEYEDDDDPEIDSSEAEEEVSVETVAVQLQQSHRDGDTATKTHTSA
ncbi:UNVERIFIED_CONTAM: hypothetical protein FKN15_074232 [Acipenser sinensis]